MNITSRRLQVGVYVKTKKRPSVFRKIVGEDDKKKWSVELCSGETETKSSTQLALVDKIDLPSITIKYLCLAPAIAIAAAAAAAAPGLEITSTTTGQSKRACTSTRLYASFIASLDEDKNKDKN